MQLVIVALGLFGVDVWGSEAMAAAEEHSTGQDEGAGHPEQQHLTGGSATQ